ncbi:MAG TPA: bifunctional phosphoglucose/phosphomannose isomerase [Acidimicrobiales bacterium]
MGSEVLDTCGMWDATWDLPEQMERAVEASYDVPDLPTLPDIEHVVVLGMGGSGVAGDVLTATAGPFIPVPVVVSKSYNVPAFVGENTLVFAISFSGNTEETLESAEIAAAQGARIVAVTSGGELADRAAGWGAPVISVPDTIPQPRAALGAMAVPPLLVLESIGLFPGAHNWVQLAVEQLRDRRERLQRPGNEAERLAKRIGRTIPLVYGGASLGAVAATRWKTQLNENAKIPAFANTHPEACHNEISGWGQHGDLTRQVFTVVNLRHDGEHPQISRRFELVDDLVDEVAASVHHIEADGDGLVAQLFDLIMIGDVTSLYLAAQEGLDPGPVPVLTDLKHSLAGS